MALVRPFKYLLDENLPRSVSDMLRRNGRDFVESRTVAPEATDQALNALASREGWVIITLDRDFKARNRAQNLDEIRKFAKSIRVQSRHDQTLAGDVLEGSLSRLEELLDFTERRNIPIRIIRVKSGQINLEIATVPIESSKEAKARG